MIERKRKALILAGEAESNPEQIELDRRGVIQIQIEVFAEE